MASWPAVCPNPQERTALPTLGSRYRRNARRNPGVSSTRESLISRFGTSLRRRRPQMSRAGPRSAAVRLAPLTHLHYSRIRTTSYLDPRPQVLERWVGDSPAGEARGTSHLQRTSLNGHKNRNAGAGCFVKLPPVLVGVSSSTRDGSSGFATTPVSQRRPLIPGSRSCSVNQ